MEDVLAHPDKPWDWKWLSENPNITMEDILTHSEKPWDWEYLSDNKFLCHPGIRLRAIKKLVKFRGKHKRKMQMMVLKLSALYDDLISIAVNYM